MQKLPRPISFATYLWKETLESLMVEVSNNSEDLGDDD